MGNCCALDSPLDNYTNKTNIITEPIQVLCVSAHYNNPYVRPNVYWLQEHGKCYAYLASEVQTDPPYYHIVVPSRLEEKATKILTKKGYKTGRCFVRNNKTK